MLSDQKARKDIPGMASLLTGLALTTDQVSATQSHISSAVEADVEARSRQVCGEDSSNLNRRRR